VICLGLDLAIRGDYTAAVLFNSDTRLITAAIRLPHGPMAEQARALHPLMARADVVAYDRTGLGYVAGEFLSHHRLIPVTISGGAGISVRKDGVTAGKMGLIRGLSDAIRSGVKIADNCPGRDDLRSEMANFCYGQTAGGRVTANARRGHDDILCAAGLALIGVLVAAGGVAH